MQSETNTFEPFVWKERGGSRVLGCWYVGSQNNGFVEYGCSRTDTSFREECGRGFSQAETCHIIELAEKYCDVYGTVEEILVSSGFNKQFFGEVCMPKFTMYSRKIGSGSFDVFFHNIPGRKELSLYYVGPSGRTSHLILSAWFESISYDGKTIIPIFYPDFIKRPMETFARVAVDLADLRTKNGPRKYHKSSLQKRIR